MNASQFASAPIRFSSGYAGKTWIADRRVCEQATERPMPGDKFVTFL